MLHYIAVLAPQGHAAWRVHLPDFPGCHADGAVLGVAIALARYSAYEQIGRLVLQNQVPRPRSLQEIVADRTWRSERCIDWRTSVITMIPFPDAVPRVAQMIELQRRRTLRWASLYGWRPAVSDPRQTELHAPPPTTNPVAAESEWIAPGPGTKMRSQR
jgi:hypothetical protein